MPDFKMYDKVMYDGKECVFVCSYGSGEGYIEYENGWDRENSRIPKEYKSSINNKYWDIYLHNLTLISSAPETNPSSDKQRTLDDLRVGEVQMEVIDNDKSIAVMKSLRKTTLSEVPDYRTYIKGWADSFSYNRKDEAHKLPIKSDSYFYDLLDRTTTNPSLEEEYTLNDLKQGRVAIENQGDVDQLITILKHVFPNDPYNYEEYRSDKKGALYRSTYICKSHVGDNNRHDYNNTELPSKPIEYFYDLLPVDHIESYNDSHYEIASVGGNLTRIDDDSVRINGVTHSRPTVKSETPTKKSSHPFANLFQ